MTKLLFRILILAIVITGCNYPPTNYSKSDIVKITSFELSPDEEKIAFSAVTPIGNLDIWVVDIDGKNLKKLTFQDRSPTNHIARFFKKHHWANYFEIDMHSPEWTNDGRIAFCQELTKYEMWGPRIISRRFRTIKPDGKDKRPMTDEDIVIQKEQPSPVNTFKVSDLSNKHKKEIFLKHGNLWYLNYGGTSPKRLIQ